MMIGGKVMQFTQNKKHAKESELRYDTRSNQRRSLHFQLELMPNYQDKDAIFSRGRGGNIWSRKQPMNRLITME